MVIVRTRLTAWGMTPRQSDASTRAIVDVALNAYGWTGPWSARRGFDSLLQMSSGIAAHGMAMAASDRPKPLPVQALDHATGYFMAAAVLHALAESAATGQALTARLSLARTAGLLANYRRGTIGNIAEESDNDIDPSIENTDWGPTRRIRFPLTIDGMDHGWDYPASRLRSADPVFKSSDRDSR